jgi:hypothetical protein
MNLLMSDADDDDLFEMVNLVPRLTGLPMTVWAQPRGNARHDARIKVNMTCGRTMDPTNLAVVGVPPTPWLVAGHLPSADLRLVSHWVRLNEAALVDYWHFTIDTDEFLAQLRKLPP